MSNWFVDNKLSIHFSQEKTKSILVGTKYKLRNAKSLNIMHNGIKVKRYVKVKNLGCILDQSLSGESMALNVIDKVNLHLKFLQNYLLTPTLRRFLCNPLIKRLKLRLQLSQNKCMKFFLQLDKRSKIHVKEFLQLNWLNVHDRYLQFSVSDIF